MDIGFRPTPKEYYVPTEKCGKMTRIRYTSSTYDEDPIAIEKDALVYLPYGYENSGIMGNYSVVVKLITEEDYLASLAEATESISDDTAEATEGP